MPLDRIESPELDANHKPLLNSAQDEHITFTAENTQLFRNGEKSEGDGTVFTTTKHLMWLSADRKVLYQMDWPYILLHAVCRDPQAFPHPCIYAQLDDEVEEEAFQHASMRQVAPDADEGKEEDEGEDEEEEDAGESSISQIHLVPANPQILDSLYNAMNACAALNPDSDASDGEGDFMFDGLVDGAEKEEEQEYGEGGEDVAAYAMSNQQRLQGLQMSMGASAEEMYGDDDDGDGGAEDEEEEVDPEYAAAAASSRKSKKPDDQSTVASQIASAAAQVTSPSAVSSSGQKGKKRENETEPNPTAAN